jgi:hypothetical protein
MTDPIPYMVRIPNIQKRFSTNIDTVASNFERYALEIGNFALRTPVDTVAPASIDAIRAV